MMRRLWQRLSGWKRYTWRAWYAWCAGGATWQRLGFGWAEPNTDFPDNDEDKHWFFGTTVVIDWPWLDILRLMVTRRSVVRVAHRTEVDVGRIRTASACMVPPPGHDMKATLEHCRRASTIKEG